MNKIENFSCSEKCILLTIIRFQGLHLQGSNFSALFLLTMSLFSCLHVVVVPLCVPYHMPSKSDHPVSVSISKL